MRSSCRQQRVAQRLGDERVVGALLVLTGIAFFSHQVGSFIGDHTKTSIGTILNTGTVVGVMCNVVTGGGMSPKFIPSFTMFLDNKMYNIPFKKTVETARVAMGRRKHSLSPTTLAVLEATLALTKPERSELVKRSRQVLAREHGLSD